MEFKRYLLEAATAAEQPVTGDSFDISVNEALNIECSVVDHQPGSVTITLDERAMNMLEQCGCEFSEELEEGVKDWMKIMALVGLTGYGASAAMDQFSPKNSPLGQALSSAAAKGDQDAAEYLRNLGAYIDGNDTGTLRMLNFRYLEEPAANESAVGEGWSYSDRGAHNMYKASRKADKEADKVRAEREKAEAGKNKDQQVDEARMSRKWELDLVQDMGNGYWISADDQSDDDVRKTAYSVYHLEDPSGLEDQQAFVWRDVGFLRVSPYRVSRDELIAAAKSVIAKDQAGAQTESVVESSDVAAHDIHGSVYGKDGKSKLFMTLGEATNVADDMIAKYKNKAEISVVQGPVTGYLVKMPAFVAEAQSMNDALKNALSKPEPGSKLHRNIQAHNNSIKHGSKPGDDNHNLMTKAPAGHHFDKKGMIRIGEETEVDEGAKEKVKGVIRRAMKNDLPFIQTRTDYAHNKAGEAYNKGDKKTGDRYMKYWDKNKRDGLGEETEVDEVSNDLKSRYIDNAKTDIADRKKLVRKSDALARASNYDNYSYFKNKKESDAQQKKIDSRKEMIGKAKASMKEESELDEAEYQGREVKLGKPTTGDVKKFKVYVKDPKTGNVKKVNFGDPNMEIKRDNPERRKNFRARHNCADKTDRTKAGYWSCRMWSNKPVSKIV